jgi:hypothetical protein
MKWSKFWRKNRDKVWEAVKTSGCAIIAVTIVTAPISELNFWGKVSAGVVSFLIGVPLVYFLNVVFTKLFGMEIIDKSEEKAQLYNLKKRQEIMDVLVEPIILASSDSNAVKDIIAKGSANQIKLPGSLFEEWLGYESETDQKLKKRRYKMFISYVKKAEIAFKCGGKQTFGIYEQWVILPRWLSHLIKLAIALEVLVVVSVVLGLAELSWFFLVLAAADVLGCYFFVRPFMVSKAKREREESKENENP